MAGNIDPVQDLACAGERLRRRGGGPAGAPQHQLRDRGRGDGDPPITLVNHPVRYDGEAAPVRLPPQPLGAQTEESLVELGYSKADIERLEAEAAVLGH